MQNPPRIRGLLCLFLLGLLAGCDNTTAAEYLDRAQASYDARDYRTAVIELKNALQQQPDLGAARFLLGRSQARLADYPSALKEFERALDLGISGERLQVELLTAKNRLGRYQEVIGELEPAVDLSAPLAAVLGDAYLGTQDLEAARQMYLQATATAAGNVGLGTIAWIQGDSERARNYLNRASELSADENVAWLRLAEFEFSQADFAAAEFAFEKALALPGGEISGRIGMARVELARGEPAQAAPYVKDVLAKAPRLFVAHYLDALIKFQQQNVDAAEAALREVQRVVPDHPPSLYLMGAVKYQQGQLSQARDNLQRFLALAPRNESAAKLLASVYLQDDETAKAIELLESVATNSTDAQLLAMLGTAQLKAGNTSAATANLRAAVELAPDAAAFRNQLALSLLSGGDPQRAAGELQAAIDIDGNQFESEYLLAMVNLQQGNFAAAESAVKDLLEKYPDNPMGYNLMGGVRLGQEDTVGAVAQFERALELNPGYLPAARSLARIDLQQGNAAAAADRFRAVLGADPANTSARLALAELALRAQDQTQAEAELRAVLQVDPQSVAARVLLVRMYLLANRVADAQAQLAAVPSGVESPQLMLLAAELDLRGGDAAAARKNAQQLQALLADTRDGDPLLLGLGALQARTGQLTLARTNLNRALNANRDNVTAQRELARIDLQEQRVADARLRLDHLLELGATGNEIRLLEADVLRQEGEAALALAAYAKLADAGSREGMVRYAMLAMSTGAMQPARTRLRDWLQTSPDDSGVRLILADALLRSAQPEAAIAEYEGLLETDSPVVLNNLAWLYMEREDPRALEMAQRAADLSPHNADIADTLGWILLQQDHAPEAVAALRRSVQLNPDNATVHYHLALAHRAAGNQRAARESLQQALALGEFPERLQAQQAMADLPGD